MRDDRVPRGQLADLTGSQRLAGTLDGLDIARRMYGSDRGRVSCARALERCASCAPGFEPGDEGVKACRPLGVARARMVPLVDGVEIDLKDGWMPRS